jgi:zinc finger BED domain-containing protein 5/7/8/9
VKGINFINANALNSRLFSKLCQEMDAQYENLLLHTEERWLSRGKVLQRIFELKCELKEFFAQRGKTNLAEILRNETHISRIAYLVDIFAILNSLNLSLQGANAIIVDSVEKLNAFRMKLDLWLQKIKTKNLYASYTE